MQAFKVETAKRAMFYFCSLACAYRHNFPPQDGEFVLERDYHAQERCANCGIALNDTTRSFATVNPVECGRLCEAISAFWGENVCDAPIWPGAYLTEQDVPIRDLVRAAVGWRKP